MIARRRRGFSAVEAIIAIFVVGAIGVTGYLAYDRMKDANKTPTASEQTVSGTAPSAPEVSTSKDLDAATKALDDTNIDATAEDSADLDSEMGNL